MKTFPLILALVLATPAMAAQKKPAAAAPAPLVEFEMMTWPEVKKAIEGGKTTALVYNGGTEQRGPQNVNGGHTLMGRATVRAIALKLGSAIDPRRVVAGGNRSLHVCAGVRWDGSSLPSRIESRHFSGGQ